MTKDRFALQMDRLCRTYGEKAYPKERLDAIWERVKAFSEARMDKAVTYLIGENFTPPSVSKIVEALSMFRDERVSVTMQELEIPFQCPPCRDFGFTFSGDLVVRCTRCELGKTIGPERLAHHQRCYDNGKKFLRKGASVSFAPLPYDPKKRIEDRSGEWA